jgi:hypothetical protein
LPALQFLQLSDDSNAEIDTVSTTCNPPPPAPTPPPASTPTPIPTPPLASPTQPIPAPTTPPPATTCEPVIEVPVVERPTEPEKRYNLKPKRNNSQAQFLFPIEWS